MKLDDLALSQLETAARLLMLARDAGLRGEGSADDEEARSEALSLLLAVLSRYGVDL